MGSLDYQDVMEFDPLATVTAVGAGTLDSFASVADWSRKAKELGQVATPPEVAELMAKWVTAGKPKHILDPAMGLGGLLASCKSKLPSAEFTGIESDPSTFAHACESAPSGTKLILSDYLSAKMGRFDGIIANPPYIKAQRLAYNEDDWRRFESIFDKKLSRSTNLYGLFLLKIWHDLAEGGRASVIIPAELFNANFGEAIKDCLQKVIRPRAIVVFSSSVSVFADALTTSCILFLEKQHNSRPPSPIVRVESIADAKQVVEDLCNGESPHEALKSVSIDSMSPKDKWLNALIGTAGGAETANFLKTVGDYFKCRRGIATGANKYFCLTASEIRKEGLDESYFASCITRATDAEGLVFTVAKLKRLTLGEKRTFLLAPTSNGQRLNAYLAKGEAMGIHKRHLPAHRPIWYAPENRSPADIWVPVFSRETAKFILNSSGARNLTCFHGLYAKEGFQTLAPLMALFLNSSLGKASFSEVHRFYGAGLNKLEPKDVEQMKCPVLPTPTASEAEEIKAGLEESEALQSKERLKRIDSLLSEFLEVG
jgi:adenine-specific DNA-methyltransferase